MDSTEKEELKKILENDLPKALATLVALLEASVEAADGSDGKVKLIFGGKRSYYSLVLDRVDKDEAEKLAAQAVSSIKSNGGFSGFMKGDKTGGKVEGIEFYKGEGAPAAGRNAEATEDFSHFS